MFRKAPRLEYNIHQQQDNIQDHIVQLQTKFDQLEQLKNVFQKTQSSIIQLTIIRLQKQLEKDITRLIQRGIPVFDILSQFGGKLLESNLLQADKTIKDKELQDGGDVELQDFVNEDKQLDRRNALLNKQQLNQKQVQEKINDIEYQQLLKGNKLGEGAKAGLWKQVQFPNQQTKKQELESLISQFNAIRLGDEVPPALVQKLNKLPISDEFKRQIARKVNYRIGERADIERLPPPRLFEEEKKEPVRPHVEMDLSEESNSQSQIDNPPDVSEIGQSKPQFVNYKNKNQEQLNQERTSKYEELKFKDSNYNPEHVLDILENRTAVGNRISKYHIKKMLRVIKNKDDANKLLAGFLAIEYTANSIKKDGSVSAGNKNTVSKVSQVSKLFEKIDPYLPTYLEQALKDQDKTALEKKADYELQSDKTIVQQRPKSQEKKKDVPKEMIKIQSQQPKKKK